MVDQTFIITFNLCYSGWRGGRSSHRGWKGYNLRFPFVVPSTISSTGGYMGGSESLIHSGCRCQAKCDANSKRQNFRKPWHSSLRDIPEWGIRMRALSVYKLLKYDQPGLIDNYIQRWPPKGGYKFLVQIMTATNMRPDKRRRCRASKAVWVTLQEARAEHMRNWWPRAS